MLDGSLDASKRWPLRLWSCVYMTGFLFFSTIATTYGQDIDNVPTANTVVNHGFLFIDGQAIVAPFEVNSQGNRLSINNTTVDVTRFSSQSSQRNTRNGIRRGKHKRRPSARPTEKVTNAARPIEDQLLNMGVGDVLILHPESEPLFLDRSREGMELLTSLVAKYENESFTPKIPDNFTSQLERDACWKILSEYEPTAQFVSKANVSLQAMQGIQQTIDDSIQSNLWSEKLVFPVTLFAMVMVVMAFGHLLSNSPNSFFMETAEQQTAMRAVMIKSLLFIAAMSLIDLVLTMSASANGTMRELNPLGKGLIHDPALLVVFKFTVTAASLGLLYRLHQYPIAQRAIWWCCLVLTLLTARWLTFQSMFV